MTHKDLDQGEEHTSVELEPDAAMSDEHHHDDKGKETPPLDSELANIIEAALYAAKEPLGIRKLISLFPDDAQPTKVDIQNVILALQEQCEHRGIELRRIGNGWRYQTKEKYSPWLRKLSGQKAPRYSRALLETLSIIAYRQPVTRGDIEEIRGVGVSSDTIRTLEERGWVTQIGHRDVPGRPALFGTSQGFLEYFNMTSLSELPELMEKRELHLIAKDMNLTLPMDGVQDETNTIADPDNNEDEPTETADVIELHPNTKIDDQQALELGDGDSVLSKNDGRDLDDQTSRNESDLHDSSAAEQSPNETAQTPEDENNEP